MRRFSFLNFKTKSNLGEYFGRSCVPGSLDYDYNRLKINPRALCLKCYSKGSDYCSRLQREMFYGSSGAFRCLTDYKSCHMLKIPARVLMTSS